MRRLPESVRRATPSTTGRRRPDRGVTLPELLVAIMVSGLLMSTISIALITLLRNQDAAVTRLAESKDITFVQTWMPVDLASAVDTTDAAVEAEVLADLAGFDPPITYSADLPGTNVITVMRPDLESGAGVYFLVAYRYLEINGDWQIARFEIRNPGQANEEVKQVGVAHEVPPPPDPATWVDETVPPTHAVEVTSRNQVVLRPIGEDIQLYFESGGTFQTGGAGLSSETNLPADYSGGFSDPSAPPSRCGGRIAIVIDTSGSVPANSGGIHTETAAVSFIDAFTGTPTELSINGFDREGYGMINNSALSGIDRYSSNGTRADYHSLLNVGDPLITMMRDRITRLDDLDGAWPGGGAPISQRDPNGDRAMWDQIGSGTNWEDGLFTLLYRSDGSPYVGGTPDLVVFMTDGEPTMIRTAGGGSTGTNNSNAADQAALVADDARSQGARVIGVMVGNKSNNTTYVNYLKRVVGDREWNGQVNGDGTIDVGNALTADLFRGEFDELGGILRSIMIAECGGTLTVQKRIDQGGSLVNPSTGVWTYSTSLGERELDRRATSSVTFDYIFGAGEVTKTVQVVEQPVAGYVWDRAECTANGAPVAALPNADGSPGATVTVEADKAVSCLMISVPA